MITHKYKIYIEYLADGEFHTYSVEWSTLPTRDTLDRLCTGIIRDDCMRSGGITFISYSVSLLTTIESTLENRTLL